jgi:hypothetical protein
MNTGLLRLPVMRLYRFTMKNLPQLIHFVIDSDSVAIVAPVL